MEENSLDGGVGRSEQRELLSGAAELLLERLRDNRSDRLEQGQLRGGVENLRFDEVAESDVVSLCKLDEGMACRMIGTSRSS